MGAMFNENRGEFSKNAIGVRGLIWQLTEGRGQVIAKMDYDTGDLVRDGKTGFAVPCGVDETGEVLHKLDPALADTQVASYYKNREAVVKRRIKDVFKKGDL